MKKYLLLFLLSLLLAVVSLVYWENIVLDNEDKVSNIWTWWVLNWSMLSWWDIDVWFAMTEEFIYMSWDTYMIWNSILTWEMLELYLSWVNLTLSWDNTKDTADTIMNFREKQQQIVDEIYTNTSFWLLLDIDSAKQQLKSLSMQFSDLVEDFNEVKDRKDKVDDKYDDLKNSIISIIQDVRGSEKEILKRITKINLYTMRLWRLKKTVYLMKEDIDNVKTNLVDYTNFLYKINNDLYWKNLNIDDIKLLVKSDDIAETLSTEDIIKSLTVNLNDLLYKLRVRQSKYLVYSKKLNNLRIQYQYEVEEFEKDIDAFVEQKKYLIELLKFFRDDKIELDEKYSDILKNREILKDQITHILNITKNKYKEVELDQWVDITKLLRSDDRNDWDRYLSWPVVDFKRISAFFNDNNYVKEFWVDHFAIDISANQWTTVYAPANWIVYKVFDQDWPYINRFIVIHKHWYVTLYLHMNEIFVNEWDYIVRWQPIWLVWWKPWTRWAWLLSTWPHLHFSVIKNWKRVDPLEVMDLSIIKSKSKLKSKYHLKYIKDRISRSTDLTDIDYIDWSTVRERRTNFVEKFWWPWFNDIAVWEDAADWKYVDVDFWICIWFAETWLWNKYARNSLYNVWNVWNNDRWDRRWFETPFQWARAIYNAINNQYLSKNYTVDMMSRFWNKEWSIYASDPVHWQRNVIRCLTTIKWQRIPEDYPFRHYDYWMLSEKWWTNLSESIDQDNNESENLTGSIIDEWKIEDETTIWTVSE